MPVWMRGFVAVGGFLVASAAAAQITEFAIPTHGSQPYKIAAGPDGNLWFTEFVGNQIGRITPTGVITEFPIPTPGSSPFGIAGGPDGNVWFVEQVGNKVGRITPAGVITEFPLPTAFSSPLNITTGPDGNLWFTELNVSRIGRITPAGVLTEFPQMSNYGADGITVGPDGRLWITNGQGTIDAITTSGVSTHYFVASSCGFEGGGIATGPDGNLWFAAGCPGRISPLGVTIPTPILVPGSQDITAGPGGTMWVGNGNIWRIDSALQTLQVTVPTGNSGPFGITAGPDGNIWFVEQVGNRVGRVDVAALSARTTIPTLDPRGMIAFAIVLLLAGAWLARGL